MAESHSKATHRPPIANLSLVNLLKPRERTTSHAAARWAPMLIYSGPRGARPLRPSPRRAPLIEWPESALRVGLQHLDRCLLRADSRPPSRAAPGPLALPLAPFAVAICNASSTSICDIQSLAMNVRNPPSLYRLPLVCGIVIPHWWRARRSLKFMPKRGSDADSRIFFDQLVSVAASRLKATGVIRLEDRQVLIPFGEQNKLIGVAHTRFPNGGSWSYFRCPKCGARSKKLWLVDARHAADAASKSSACATARATASADPSA